MGPVEGRYPNCRQYTIARNEPSARFAQRSDPDHEEQRGADPRSDDRSEHDLAVAMDPAFDSALTHEKREKEREERDDEGPCEERDDRGTRKSERGMPGNGAALQWRAVLAGKGLEEDAVTPS